MILRSSGKNFSAGADLDWMKRMAGYTRDENVRDANALAELLHKLNFLPVPTIARVQGAAMGGGCGLVACCDIALAADNAVFAFSEVKLGLIPATISPYVLRAIGEKQARRYFQTAERFSAVQAGNWAWSPRSWMNPNWMMPWKNRRSDTVQQFRSSEGGETTGV